MVSKFVGELIHTQWTGDRLEWDQTFFLLMIIAAFTESLQIFSKVIPIATNQHVQMTQKLLINAMINLPILWVLLQMTGFYGIAWMLLLHNAVRSLIVLRCALRQLDEVALDYWIYLLSPNQLFFNVQKLVYKVKTATQQTKF
jgi:hypothetical protein